MKYINTLLLEKGSIISDANRRQKRGNQMSQLGKMSYQTGTMACHFLVNIWWTN